MSTETEADYCFAKPEGEPLTDYEVFLEILYALTGKCFCNLCQSQQWGGYNNNNRENDT